MIMAASALHIKNDPDTGVPTYEHSSLPINEKGLWLARPRTSSEPESAMEAFWSNTVEDFLNDRRTADPNDAPTQFVPPQLANGNNSCWMNAVLQVLTQPL
jgi:hypothetical protein